jgi:hypothetical protein
VTSLREPSFEGGQRSPEAPRQGPQAGGGRPLGTATRAAMEARLGHSFSDVRVHPDERAAATVDTTDAPAFTVGRDVFFAPGRYRPGTTGGRRLLAHELAHVVQQSGTPRESDIAADQGRVEREAEAAAEAVAAGRSFLPQLRMQPGLAHQEEAEAAQPVAPAPVPEAAVEAAEVATRFRDEQLEFAADRVGAATRGIGARLVELRARPEAERAALRAEIHGLERELADALADRVGLLERHLPELEQRRAAGEDVEADLERARRELAEHREDLGRLGGVFAPEKGAAFEATYRTMVAGLNCMEAAYKGLGALRTPEESAEIERRVEEKAEQGMKRKKPVDLNQFITVMDTASAERVAGPKQRARWSRKAKTWTPTLESLVRARVHPAVPGFWFFGLALAEAYHSVLVGVSTWDEPARTLWCDQHGCRLVPGTLDDFARGEAEGLAVPYPDWDTYVWQVVPPPEASLLQPPEEAK